MDGREFREKVSAHEDLEWLGARQGVDPSTDEVYVAYSVLVGPEAEPRRKRRATFALPVSEILAGEWDELEAVLTGKRRGQVLTHLTRIVGYFSQVHNWNRSKHAELTDRQAGTYGVSEKEPQPVAAM